MQEPQCGVRMLEEYLDQHVFVLLRENSCIYGILRSFDQYHNMLLENATEISIFEDEYSEVQSEVTMLRGENVAIIGYAEDKPEIALRKVDPKTISKKSKHTSDEDLNFIDL